MTNIPNTPTSKKDDRPFYKKKRVLIPAGLLIVGIIGAQMDKGTKANTASSSAPAATEQASTANSSSGKTGGLDLKTRVENNIKSIDGGDDLTKNEMTSATAFQITAAIYKAYASTIQEGKQSTDKEVLKLTSDLEKKVIASQVKNFPKIRKAYYQFIKQKLWENDVYVDISGSDNTVLKFTGAYFAANKNIKTTQETVFEMLTLLRFKQTQYTWYKGQDEYTYFKLETAKDTEIVE